jgi:arthrofactin-type cyclic lipopeptide synthetase C
LGYEEASSRTTERDSVFVADPYSERPDARMFRTGDWGKWLGNGKIALAGRKDQQVKISGDRVELLEIEAVLNECPGLNQAAVVMREGKLNAFVVPESGELLEVDKLQTHLRERLPEYMVPVEFTILEQLPVTGSGTIDRQKLSILENDAAHNEPPVGEVEMTLAAIWAEVLNLERVGRRDDFFKLGGHSLATLRVVNLLSQAGINILATDIFSYPQLHSLAARITSENGRAFADTAIPVRKAGTETPLFLTHEGAGELLYLQALAPHIDGNIPIYGLPAWLLDQAPLRTVEAMATRMVRMIRAVQPVGPYRIAGWSVGGVLAYEVAAQLIGADQQVEFLGLFDTNPPFENEEPDQPQAPELSPEQRRFQIRSRAFYEAQRDFSVQKLPIPVHLFAAQENTGIDRVRGWANLVPPNLLRRIPVPGTHFSMMQSPNIEILGRAVSQAIHNATTLQAQTPEQSYSPLVTLQYGNSRLFPVFCVPGAGANVSSFVDLAGCLANRHVHGLQPRGLDGALLPHSTVEAASECYLRAILDIHPFQPLHLLGHSFGGWIAFELARRLQKAGHTVASLTIVDSDVPDDDPAAAREYTSIEALISWIKIFEKLLDHPLAISQAELETLDEAAQRRLLHRRLVKEGLMPRNSDPEFLCGPLRTFATAVRAVYKPNEIYPGPIQLVLADDPKLDEAANLQKYKETTEGWKRWAPNLVCTRSHGNHMTVLKPLHVHDVARLIQDPVIGSTRNGDSKPEQGVQESLAMGSD